ncbi:hypothetical protein MASR1M48_16380 [Lactococcus petauri]
MFNPNHFDGGSNLNAGHGSKHLGIIILALLNDLVKVLGIKGILNISTADSVAVASADSTDEPTLVVLVNEEKGSYNGIAALANSIKTTLSPLTILAISEPAALVSSVANATNTATAITLVNDLKAKYNAAYLLLNQIKAELNVDGTVVIAAANLVVEATVNASDLATAIALSNALKVKLNAAVTLANEIKSDLNGVEKVVLESTALFA